MATTDRSITVRDPSIADLARVLGHPEDVLAHRNLTVGEKRELLAAWASDAHAVADAPGLRQLDSGAIVSVEEVLSALRALDEPSVGRGSTIPVRRVERHRRPSLSRLLVTLTRRDDDDDPPPLPAAALPPGLEYARRRRWEPCGNPEPVAA